MIGKGVTIGRSVVELQDLFLDYLENNSGDINNKTVEKIIPIHRMEKNKRSGFNSGGQGYDSNYNLWRLKFDKCAMNACCWKTRTES